jgi:hypothetical protein
MTNHWREGSNPLNPIYNLLKPLSFNVGDYVSQYISPNIDSTYGQHYPFEINILFYLIVIFVLCGVLYGCN